MRRRLISLFLCVCLVLPAQMALAPSYAVAEEDAAQQTQQASYTGRFLVKYRTPADKPAAEAIEDIALAVAQRDTVKKVDAEALQSGPATLTVQQQAQLEEHAQLSAVQAGAVQQAQSVQPQQPASTQASAAEPVQVQSAQVSEAAGGLSIIQLDTAVEPETFAEQLAEELGSSVEYVQPDYLLSLSAEQEYELNLDLEGTATEQEAGSEAVSTPATEPLQPVGPLQPIEPQQPAETPEPLQPVQSQQPFVTATPGAALPSDAPSEPPAEPSQTPEASLTPLPTAQAIDAESLMGDTASDIAAAHALAQGAGVKIAVIDGGMDTTHPSLAGRLTDGYDFLADAPLTYDESNPMGQIHATHIAGLIASIAPQAQIIPLKVFDGGFAYTSDILSAIEYAEAHGAQIINCSFGSGEDNPALREAIQASSALFVCAAGNARSDLADQPAYPAAYGFQNVVSVASLNADMGFSYYSNYGTGVDIAALGRDVESAYPGGGTGAMSGTSVSAAYVSGAAALAASAGAADVKARLLDSAYRLSHLQNKVDSGRMLGIYAAVSGLSGQSLRQVTVAEDFDVHGYEPTPEEGWALFSSLPNRQVAAIENSTFVLKEDGSVWAWGENTWGMLGYGTGEIGIIQNPVRVPGLTDIVQLSTGFTHCLALKADGTVWGWGGNWNGQVSPNAGESTCPIQIAGLSEVKQIDAGDSANAAVKLDGTVVTWGDNTYGQLGNLAGFEGVKEVRASDGHMLALKNDGSVWRWGGGNSSQEPVLVPEPVPGLSDVVQIFLNSIEGMSFAVKEDGSVWTWFGNGSGIGDSVSSNSVPDQVEGLANIKQVAASKVTLNVFAIDNAGNLWAWGLNSGGQLGDGTKTERPTPVQITGISNVVDVSTGYEHTVALDGDGRVWIWGQNDSYQIGLPDTTAECLVPSLLGGHINQDPDDLTVLYNRTYQGENPFAGADIAAKTNAITHEIDAAGNGYIKIAMANPADDDDCYFGVSGVEAPAHLVVEARLALQVKGARPYLEIKDASRGSGTLLYIDQNGNLISGSSNQGLRQLQTGEWVSVAVVIDTENLTKTIYLNGAKVEENVSISGISGIEDIRFYLRPQYTGTLLVDDFKIYGGTEPRSLENDEPGLFPNPGRSFYRSDYNNSSAAFSGATYEAGSNSITHATEGENGYIKITTANPPASGSYFGVEGLPAARYKVMEVSLRASSGAVRMNLESKDVSRSTGYFLFMTDNHWLTSAASGTYLGTVAPNQWTKVAVVIDEENHTYSTYIDGELKEENVPVMGEVTDFSTLRVYVRETHAGDLHIDDLKIYELGDAASDGVPNVHMQDGMAQIELENARLEPWQTESASAAFALKNGKGSNGNGYVAASGGVASTSGVDTAPLRVAVTVPFNGQYYVWLRSMSEAETPGKLWLGIDGGAYASVTGAQDARYGWKWRRVLSTQLAAGRHILSLCPQQGGGSYDTILVTDDATYIPADELNTNLGYLSYEMEDATLGLYEDGANQAWMTKTGDALASETGALTAHVQGNLSIQPIASKTAPYEQTVQIANAGMYAIWVRASVASLSPSAAWLSVDDAAYQNYSLAANYPAQRGQYRWNKLGEAFLTAGEHSVRLLGQYANDKFDKLILTRVAGYTPSNSMQEGYMAVDCAASEASAKTVGGVTASFLSEPDASAQGGSALVSQVEGGSALPRPEREDSGMLSYQFDASEAGTYEVYIYGSAQQPLSNSLWLAIDGQNYWDVYLGEGSGLHWSKVQTADLSAGPHTIKIAARDALVALDQLVIRKQGLDGPEGMMVSDKLELEAEDAALSPYVSEDVSAGFEAVANTGASGGEALKATLTGAASIESAAEVASAQMSLDVLLGRAAKYNIWIRASVESTDKNSIYYSIGGQAYQQADLALPGASTPGAWTWTKISTLNLPTGIRTLDFAVCEPGVLIDKVLVTSDLSYAPQGGDASGGDSFAAAVPLTLPAQVSGSIASAGAERYYTFTAPQQEEYAVSLAPSSGFHAYLYAPDESQQSGYALLASSEASADGRLSYTLTEGAAYYVKVAHASGGTGSYTLSISAASEVGSGSFTTEPLAVGDAIKVKLTATGATASHTFRLTYDPAYLQLTSLAAQRYEPSVQPGAYDGIVVESVSSGSVVFRLDAFEPVGSSWSGLLSIFAFEAIAEGSSALTLETL